MDLVLGHDKSVADWAGRKLGSAFSEPYTAWGVIDGSGTLVGALVFNEFQRGGNISLSVVGGAAIQRGIMRAAARYVFNQLQCTRCTARTRRSNKRMRKILDRSWEFESVAKYWFGPMKQDDAFVFVMHRAAAQKWIR